MEENKIRNIAIIAHVDHGKTSLVDRMLQAGNLFRDPSEKLEQVLDNNDLERERGITIFSKNVSIQYKDYKINIIDTPGHADFGGEVERVLNMADGCLVLVDAFEGPMPQTRFVLEKALRIGLKPILVINKVDKPNCRPDEVQEKVFDLMFDLDASEEQLEFPTFYGSAKQGWMSTDWHKPTKDITALLDGVIKYIPAPPINEGPLQMLITSLSYSSYVGRIAIGRVHRGTIRSGQEIALMKSDGTIERQRIKELDIFSGLGRQKVGEVHSGDLCAVIGIDGFEIGETIADPESPEMLPTIAVDEPTMSMRFLPDALLLQKNKDLKAIDYKDLKVDLRAEDFKEEGEIAKDATILEKTYKHANKDGSPDKRYKDNPEVSLVEYGILQIENSDLNLMIGFSDTVIDGK